MRARLNLDKDNFSAKNKMRPNTSVTYRKNNDFYSKNETRNQIIETMRGTKNLLKGVTGRIPVSDYHENYKYYIFLKNFFLFKKLVFFNYNLQTS